MCQFEKETLRLGQSYWWLHLKKLLSPFPAKSVACGSSEFKAVWDLGFDQGTGSNNIFWEFAWRNTVQILTKPSPQNHRWECHSFLAKVWYLHRWVSTRKSVIFSLGSFIHIGNITKLIQVSQQKIFPWEKCTEIAWVWPLRRLK